MPKASTPLRITAELLRRAAEAAPRFHRSTAAQVTYWAELGERVSALLDPNVLDQVQAGIARLRVEPVLGEPIDPAPVFAALEAERSAGTLPGRVTRDAVRYQASHAHPGWLERIDAAGGIELGRFRDGEFVPQDARARS